MYVSMSHLQIPEEHAEELIEAFRGRAHLVDDADGFVDLEVWHSDRNRDEVIMVSRWRDRESFKRYMKSGDHQCSHQRIPAALKSAIKLQNLAHLHTYDVVAT
jgi:heme-degrading monooxygenase HmoA